ncbi:MAG: motility associated factor glycosyltransferase family protein [Spirochaetales bacterium]|nr:motility associated factor glycosyltransferase family protein [Spirochaetales bacterium]
MSTIFERNLLALSSCDPRLSAQISGVTSSIDTQIILSKSGHPVPVISRNNRDTPLHSRFDPQKEGEKYLKHFEAEGFLVFLGLGAGYQIEPFLKQNEVTQVVIIEKEFSYFKYLLENIDLSALIINPKVRLIVGYSDREVEEFLLKNYLPCFSGNLKTISLASRVNLDRSYFENIIEVIRNVIGKIADDYTVQVNFGRRWFINTIKNLEKAEKTYFRLPSNRKIIITGAGPSLENQIPLIKKKHKDALLIATDTSLLTLLAYDIVPDLTLSIDCQHISYHHFLKGIPDNIPLVLDLASPPLLTRLTDNILFFSSGHPFSQFISNYWRAFPNIDTSGGNVSHAALSLARYLGAEKVYLYGIDFSFPEGKAYSRESYLYPYFRSSESRTKPLESSFFNFIFKDKKVIKEQIKNYIRYTTRPMINYKKRLEEIVNNLEINVIQENSMGIPLDVKHFHTDVNKLPRLISQGPAKTSWKEFLIFFNLELSKLPKPFSPISEYLYHLELYQRDLLMTLFPAASTIGEKLNPKNLKGADLLDETIQWSTNIINQFL